MRHAIAMLAICLPFITFGWLLTNSMEAALVTVGFTTGWLAGLWWAWVGYDATRKWFT